MFNQTTSETASMKHRRLEKELKAVCVLENNSEKINELIELKKQAFIEWIDDYLYVLNGESPFVRDSIEVFNVSEGRESISQETNTEWKIAILNYEMGMRLFVYRFLDGQKSLFKKQKKEQYDQLLKKLQEEHLSLSSDLGSKKNLSQWKAKKKELRFDDRIKFLEHWIAEIEKFSTYDERACVLKKHIDNLRERIEAMDSLVKTIDDCWNEFEKTVKGVEHSEWPDLTSWSDKETKIHAALGRVRDKRLTIIDNLIKTFSLPNKANMYNAWKNTRINEEESISDVLRTRRDVYRRGEKSNTTKSYQSFQQLLVRGSNNSFDLEKKLGEQNFQFARKSDIKKINEIFTGVKGFIECISIDINAEEADPTRWSKLMLECGVISNDLYLQMIECQFVALDGISHMVGIEGSVSEKDYEGLKDKINNLKVILKAQQEDGKKIDQLCQEFDSFIRNIKLSLCVWNDKTTKEQDIIAVLTQLSNVRYEAIAAWVKNADGNKTKKSLYEYFLKYKPEGSDKSIEEVLQQKRRTKVQKVVQKFFSPESKEVKSGSNTDSYQAVRKWLDDTNNKFSVQTIQFSEKGFLAYADKKFSEPVAGAYFTPQRI